MPPISRRAALTSALAATAASTTAALAFADAASADGAARPRPGTLVAGSAPSPTLGGGEEIAYTAYLPYGYDRSRRDHPVVYLLHGRGDSMTGWTRAKDLLDRLITAKRIPPVIAILPDAPWSDRGSYYVDSAYTGAPAGRPVETALTVDLVSHVDATYRTAATREGRVVGGYSMGGAGALRYVLARQDLFGAALVLSPAVYTPLPPVDSSTREFGAFGRGSEPFVDEVYREKNYPALLSSVDTALPVHLYVAVGDDEWANERPEDFRHDLDFEAAVVYNQVKRTPGVTAQFRVLDGGHDWDVWLPAFEAGLPYLLGALDS